MAGLVAAGSFALAMLTRSTGWAIAAAIGFVAVFESSFGACAGGLDVRVGPGTAGQSTGSLNEGSVPPDVIRIDDTRALATLVAVVAVGCCISWWSLRSRDVE